jgi:class 3 adenylate cyclase
VEAERRQVTVLFTDVVGFTAFSEKSGEEAAFELMRSLWRLMDEAVREQGGVVRNFTGDGIMAVFGAPSVKSTPWPTLLCIPTCVASRLRHPKVR